ncbi:MAG: APC family permease [Pseudomonadota bacterium]
MAMKRNIGLVGLTFVAVSGVLGSGWLFAPLLTSQIAGPAAMISWFLGAVAMLLLALAFAEISAMFPVAGGIARIPQFSHGRLLGMFMGWSAWAGYCTAAPIEVEAALRYASDYLPWVYGDTSGGLSTQGLLLAAVVLAVFTVINFFGVQWFARVNTTLTWFKLIVPVIFVATLLSIRFEPTNFTEFGGFAPYGVSGIFAAVASGGVAFAFLGFRHTIDMAGETKNPQRVIPLALIISLVICFFVYAGIQVAFIGALDADMLADGWKALRFTSELGPLGAIAAAVGALWLVSLLNASAVVSPLGGGLVSVSSNGRLAMAMAQNGVFPDLFARLNRFGVPFAALVLNYVVALVMLISIPFAEVVALNGAAIVLSLVTGPVAVLSLRALTPETPRPFHLPWAKLIAPLGFTIATLLVFWSGWETTWRLLALLGVGMVLFALRLAVIGRENLHPRGVLWLPPYLAGIAALSYYGSFVGGRAIIPTPYDSLGAAVVALLTFYFALACRLKPIQFGGFLKDELDFEIQEYGHPDPADLLETGRRP